MNRPSDDNMHLPDTITERLARADRSVSIVSPGTDQAVLELARQHFSGRDQRTYPRPERRWAVPAAIAASVLLALFVVRPAGLFGPITAGPDDIDGSGQVDILDAFALARAESDAVAPVQADVDALVMRIVSLAGNAP